MANEIDGAAIAPDQSRTGSDPVSFILDRDWAKTSFLLSDSQIEDADDIKSRYWSSASSKFTDTRLGCNIGINSRPQFTRYSDIRVEGRLGGRGKVSLTNVDGNYGMGRYYSEAIDDPGQVIYLRFGVPQFNSLLNFLSSAYDYKQITLARTGRLPSVLYDLASAGAAVAVGMAYPPIAILAASTKALNFIFGRPTNKFYTLKPTMHTYWSTVNVLANTIAINRGIFPKILGDESAQQLGEPYKLDEEYLTALSAMLPDVFRDGKTFDIFAMANRAQILANALFEQDYQALNQDSPTAYEGYLKKETGDGTHPSYISTPKGTPTLLSVINHYLMNTAWYKEDKTNVLEANPKIDPKTGKVREDKGWFAQFAESADAEFRSGSQYATFRVDHTGPVQESFSNSVVESDLSQKLNTIASQARETRFSFADGNLSNDMISKGIGTAIGLATDTAMGLLDGATMGFSNLLPGLGGSGFIQVPKHWQSSTASLPKSSYTMDLVSPYGNAISQMQNIYIPLCMILAGALPIATGKQSYGSPFICEIWDRGRCQSRLSMIESISISRGTGHLAFDTRGHALAVQVTFSLVDLTSLIHMPISAGGMFEGDMTLDEDNLLCDYLAVIAGQDIYTQTYPFAKGMLRIAKGIMSYRKFTSPAWWGSMAHEELTAGIFKYTPVGPIFNLIEGVTRGSDALKRNEN